MEVIRYSILLRHTNACAESAHSLCGDPAGCVSTAALVTELANAENDATEYDAQRIAIEHRNRMPDHTWSTTALVMCIKELLMSQPNIDGLYRATAITTALARLGERGINADWLIRVHMGPPLVRHIILVATSVWHQVATGALGRNDVPELHGWLNNIDFDAPVDYNPTHHRARLITCALSGTTRQWSNAWLNEAAIADILMWKSESYTVSRPDISDLSTSGGRNATRWIFDRITRTYMEEWDPRSLAWETAYIIDPVAVASRAGVPQQILKERITTHAQIARAASAHVLRDLGEIFPGVSRNELVELAAHHLERGELEEARALSEAAFSERPGDPTVRSVYAFCWIPTAPGRSRELMCENEKSQTTPPATRIINRASSYLVEVDTASAVAELDSLDEDTPACERPAWLWAPASLQTKEPEVIYTTPTRWKEELLRQLSDGSN